MQHVGVKLDYKASVFDVVAQSLFLFLTSFSAAAWGNGSSLVTLLLSLLLALIYAVH